jgi:ATP-binding cassette subfamily B protein
MTILFGFTSTLLYGGYLTFENQLSVGSFSMLIFLTQRLLWPLTGLAATADLYERAMASLSRILDVVDKPDRFSTEGAKIEVISQESSIEFKDVSFSYNSGTEVLSNLNLQIQAGQTVALVGATGSGKSTLAKLLLRFYEVQQGIITLGGVPISDYSLQSLRNRMGFVNQDVFLFHGTVSENIAYGKGNSYQNNQATMAEILEAAKLAEAHEFIVSFPEGYNTLVGERGLALSGGQRQRITLARALIKNPPILIFDEATSALDNETEIAIQRSLKKVCQNRTTIVIAHRLSTIKNSDCIFVFDKGSVIESGTHDSLVVKENGTYARLWKAQSAEL